MFICGTFIIFRPSLPTKDQRSFSTSTDSPTPLWRRVLQSSRSECRTWTANSSPGSRSLQGPVPPPNLKTIRSRRTAALDNGATDPSGIIRLCNIQLKPFPNFGKSLFWSCLEKQQQHYMETYKFCPDLFLPSTVTMHTLVVEPHLSEKGRGHIQ